MSFTVRPIEDADIDPVVQLWTEAGVTRPWNDPRRDIELCRKSSHSTILIGLHAGAIVATVQVGEDGHRGWVYYVAVLPELQGSGMGRRIMQAAEDWLRARGIWKLNLLVRADNLKVIEFYQRLGYRDTSVVCLQKEL
jgi:ribosomal protein S18 acetylase RimI-like enzyme